MRFLGGAASAAVVMSALTVLALTGCGSQATQPTSTPTVTVAPTATVTATPSATATPTAPVTGTATPEPTTTTTAAADPGRPKGQCADDSLGVSVVIADGGGGAGSEAYNVLFTNTGGVSCVLRGTPGVSVVGDGNGTQLGAAATRSQSGVKTITLGVGDTVAAPLSIVNIGTDGGPLEGCTVQKGDGYRIYPPHSTRAFFYQDTKAVACVKGPSFMTVRPVEPRTD
jgi:hypothetical protein